MGTKPKGDPLMVIAFGKKKPGAMGKRGSPMGMSDHDDEMAEDPEMGESDEPPPDFEDEAIKAFPELEGSPERIQALYRAMKACS